MNRSLNFGGKHAGRIFMVWVIFIFQHSMGLATNYYVSTSGNDINKGTKWFKPLFTIQKAHDLAEAGDTILVMNGEYLSYSANHILHITKSGEENRWIVYKNYPNHKPVIRINKEYGFFISKVNYISIEGFYFKEPKLPKDSFTLSKKIGVYVEGSETHPCRNIKIYNCDFSYCPTAALLFNFFDYAKIYYNKFFRNATQVNSYGALVLMNGMLTDAGNFAHNIITGNVFEKNGILDKPLPQGSENQLQAAAIKLIDIEGTEGFENSRTQIYNNILYTNGSGGVYIANSSGLDFVNNSLYKNTEEEFCQLSELHIINSLAMQVYNNIFYATSSKPSTLSRGKCGITYKNNLHYNSSSHEEGEGDIIEDPLFESMGDDSYNFNFRLSAKSPAINSGIDELLPNIDYEGNKRKFGLHVDIGALEHNSVVVGSIKNEKNPFLEKKSIQQIWSSYYNPQEKTYTIWNNRSRGFILKIMDSNGRILVDNKETDEGISVKEIDLSRFKPGIYEIISFSSKEEFREKITIH